jgi:hypothetical protein
MCKEELVCQPAKEEDYYLLTVYKYLDSRLLASVVCFLNWSQLVSGPFGPNKVENAPIDLISAQTSRNELNIK